MLLDVLLSLFFESCYYKHLHRIRVSYLNFWKSLVNSALDKQNNLVLSIDDVFRS